MDRIEYIFPRSATELPSGVWSAVRFPEFLLNVYFIGSSHKVDRVKGMFKEFAR
jgi:hypothetical protein